MSIRDEINEFCIAHDRFMAEQASEPIRSPTVSETDEPRGLVYKRYDNAPAPAAQPEPDWSDWEAWLQGHLAILRQQMIKGVAEGVMMLIHRERDAFERKLADLRAENAELRGKLDVVLTMVGQKSRLWKPGDA
jgi:hypothetical protein